MADNPILAVSQTSIANIALLRIGAKPIVDINQTNEIGAKVRVAWSITLQEMLEEEDWRFCKTRVNLARLTIVPVYTYQYAYGLPQDFLRLVRQKENYWKALNPVAYTPGYSYQLFGLPGSSAFFENNLPMDPPVYPPGYPYIIETVQNADGLTYTKALLANYDDTNFPIGINYIRLETDPTKYSAKFISAFAARIAAELAISVTESLQKFNMYMTLYSNPQGGLLESAISHNRSLDYIDEEAGSTTWQDIGRCL